MFENINDNFKYLDPACGCGNFIRAALTRTREYYNNREFTNEEKLVLITDAVTGIDIDPTAVILSKAVWAMTLADLIRESERPVDIPIYHADSLFIAKDETTADGDEVTGNPVISFDEVKIEIPNLYSATLKNLIYLSIGVTEKHITFQKYTSNLINLQN